MRLRTVGNKFQILDDEYISGYIIPSGFITDFATIPRWALSILGSPAKQEYRRASVLHDYLLAYSSIGNKESSKIFHKVLLEDGTKPFKAYIMYLAVRYLRNLSIKGIFK